MKQIYAILLLAAVCPGLAACHDPGPMAYPDAAPQSHVERVELLRCGSESIQPFDWESVELLEVLGAERVEDFNGKYL